MTLGLPSISQYVDSIANPFGLTRTLGEFVAERDIYGQVRIRAGNNAAVFRVGSNGRKLMLKCYIKQGLHTRSIYKYISDNPDRLLSDVKLLEEELYVYDMFDNGLFYDVVVSDWVEGDTLDTAIRFAAKNNDAGKLSSLSESFDRLAAELLAKEWAHGDLKPENIVVRHDGTMTLIDYDAMFIPELAGERTLEVGTPGYQHPSRDETVFCKNIDDYPVALISTSLRALANNPSLYDKYNSTDNIIFYPEEIMAGNSDAYKETLELFVHHGDHASYNLAILLKSPVYYITDIARILGKKTAGNYGVGTTGKLSLFEKDGLWGYGDTKGNTAIDPIYEDATEFSENKAVVQINGVTQVIDTKGHVVLSNDRFDIIKPYSCGLAAVCKDGRWGYINHEGDTVIGLRFRKAGSMRENRAAVLCISEAGEEKWGYIGTDGKFIIKPQYDYASSFRNGRATTYSGGLMLNIDIEGCIINCNI